MALVTDPDITGIQDTSGTPSYASLTLSGSASIPTTLSVTSSPTIASAASAVWNGISVPTSTATLSGVTNVTTATGFNLFSIAAPALVGTVTVTNSATMYIGGAPSITGGGAITNAYALWVDAGNVRIDAQLLGGVGAAATPTISVGGVTTGLYSASAAVDLSFSISGARTHAFQTGNIQILSDSAIIYLGAGADTLIARDAANVVALKNSTTAQTLRVYGTTTGPVYLSLSNDGTNSVISANSGNIVLTASAAAATAVTATVASSTIVGAVTDGYTAGLRLTPTYDAATALTVTRHNYIDINTPTLSGAGPAAVTDACVFRFNAAAGTHLAVDSGTTKTTPGTVDAWVIININGTLHYMGAYTSKTS